MSTGSNSHAKTQLSLGFKNQESDGQTSPTANEYSYLPKNLLRNSTDAGKKTEGLTR
jgi:hypothetical protein